MSDRPTDPDTPRAERLAARALGTLAALATLAGAILLTAQSTGALSLTPKAFALTMCWAIGTGCLGFGVCMLRRDDPHIVRALTHGPRYGDPALDSVLIPMPRGWRTRPATRRALATAAACAWILAAIYTGQYAAGIYQVRTGVAVFTLSFFLAPAIWCTVITLALTADARREAAYNLACNTHRDVRDKRGRLDSLAAPIETGEDDEDDEDGDDEQGTACGVVELHVVRDGERGSRGTPNAVALLAPLVAFGAWLRTGARLRAGSVAVAVAATVTAGAAQPTIRAPYTGPRSAPPPGGPAAVTPAAATMSNAPTPGATTSQAPQPAPTRTPSPRATAAGIPAHTPPAPVRTTAPAGTPRLPSLPAVVKVTSTPPVPTKICLPLITVCVPAAG